MCYLIGGMQSLAMLVASWMIPPRINPMKNLLFLVFTMQIMVCAQTITITSPTSNQTINGTGFTLTVSYSALPALYSVEYQVNGERMCIRTAPPYSCVWNTNYVVNGAYNSIQAVARDATNTVIATSALVSPVTVNNPLPETASQLTMSVSPSTPVTSSWSGTVTFTVTVSGSNASAHCGTSGACQLNYWIDGKLVTSQYSVSGTVTQPINTARFDNGSHFVVISLLDSTNPTGGGGGAWDQVSQWEQPVTFANGAAAMEVRANAREIFLCTTSQTLCPTTFTLVPTQVNTDESTSSPGTCSYSSSNTAAATVGSSTGVVTEVGVGNAQITITCGSLSRIVWAYVNTANMLPHFGNDGSILTAYNPAKSMWLSGLFQSSNGLTDSNYPAWASFQADYAAAGHNVVEMALEPSGYPSGGQSESAFDAQQTSYVTSQVSALAPYGLYAGLIGDGITRGNQQMYYTTQSSGSNYATPAVQYMFQSWVGNHALYAIMQDEVQATNGHCPLCGAWTIGGSLLTQIACTSGTTCTVTAPSWSLATECGGGNGFIIHGSGNTNLDFNTTSGAPSPFVATSVDANHFTFPTPAGVGTTTFTSSSNPGLTIEPFGEAGFDNSTACNLFPCPGPPCGSSSGPLVSYLKGNAFSVLMGWANNVSGRVKMTWPPDEGGTPTDIANWMGDPRMADFANIYITDLNPQYLAHLYPLTDMLAGTGDVTRNKYANVQRLAPIIGETYGSGITWGMQGTSAPVASIANDVITFSSPHGLSNIIPGDTRLSITGNSNSTFNTNYYVREIVDSTHLRVVYQCTTSGGMSATGGVVTFQDGTVFGNGGGNGAAMVGINTGCPGNLQINSNTPASFVNKRGNTFTMSGVTGTGSSYFNSTTFFYDVESNLSGWNQWTNNFREVPSGSGTGGTASILANNNMVRGVNWTGPNGNEEGPRYPFASYMYNVILGESGTRIYYLGGDFDGVGAGGQSNTFTSTFLQDVQGGSHPRWDFGGAVKNWTGLGMGARLAQRLVPYIFQPRLTSPDYGYYFECTARSGSLGNFLGCQSFADGTLTRTINLAPYLVSGQAILRHYCTWTGCTTTSITAGTTSDTVTFDPGSWVDYVFANNAAAEWTPPTLSVRPADVPNASNVVVQYAYMPQVLNWPSVQAVSLPNSTISSGGSLTLPTDPKIGHVYYRLIYLNSSNQILSTSDVQGM